MASSYMEVGDEEEKFSLSGHRWFLSCELKTLFIFVAVCAETLE